MTEHRIGTQEEWQAERDELLKEEKELTRRKRASEIDGAVPALEVGGVN